MKEPQLLPHTRAMFGKRRRKRLLGHFTYKVLCGDVGAVEGEGRDRLDVAGRRGQVEGGAAVLREKRASSRRETDPRHDTYDTSLRENHLKTDLGTVPGYVATHRLRDNVPTSS